MYYDRLRVLSDPGSGEKIRYGDHDCVHTVNLQRTEYRPGPPFRVTPLPAFGHPLPEGEGE